MQRDRNPRYEGEAGRNKILQILKRNALVGGDEAIAAEILNLSDEVNFRKGDVIIAQGAGDDDVYFLLSGSVRITIKGKARVIVRDAPVQIGEMAALNPNDKRSATVTAKDDGVTALKLAAQYFHQIGDLHPKFIERARSEQNERNKAWKDPGTEGSWNSVISVRFLASLFAAAALSVICYWIATEYSIIVALVTFFATLSILLLISIFLSRTAILYSCFAATGTGTAAYVTFPIAFKFEMNFSWAKGTIESPPPGDPSMIVALICLTLIFLGAAIYSGRQDSV